VCERPPPRTLTSEMAVVVQRFTTPGRRFVLAWNGSTNADHHHPG